MPKRKKRRKIDPLVYEKIEAMIANGKRSGDAIKEVGINGSSYYRWLRKNRGPAVKGPNPVPKQDFCAGCLSRDELIERLWLQVKSAL